MYLQWTDLHLQIRFQQGWMMGGRVSVCVFVFLVGCGVTARAERGGGGGLGLVGRLPLCWETEGVWQAGRLFRGPPESVPKESRDHTN